MTYLLFFIILVIVAAAMAQYMVYFLMKRVLRRSAKIAIELAWKKVHEQSNPILRIIEADKIFDEALRLLGYRGTLSDKLKVAGPRFTNLNALWSAHKLRNTLVHRLDGRVGDKEVENALQAFRIALKSLGANI